MVIIYPSKEKTIIKIITKKRQGEELSDKYLILIDFDGQKYYQIYTKIENPKGAIEKDVKTTYRKT